MLCCGDLFIWASPNAGNPQKVQRYPLEWADALRRMLALYDRPGGGPEVLLPGHGVPVVGRSRVIQALSDTAELLESLVSQTLALMNRGARLDEVIHTVTPPPHLMERPYLRPVYDEPEFVVRTVWRLYGGWWDGNPATLKPAPDRDLALELAALAGGPGVLADRALALLPDEGTGSKGAHPVPPGKAKTTPCDWPGTWPNWRGWPPRTTPACRRCAGLSSPGGPMPRRPPWPTACSRGRPGSPAGHRPGRRPDTRRRAVVGTLLNWDDATRGIAIPAQLLILVRCPLVSSP